MGRQLSGVLGQQERAAGKGGDTVRCIVIICAPCSCAKTICGTGVCPATGTWLPRNIPSSTINRLYVTRFLCHLILALLHTEGKERTPRASGSPSLSPENERPDFALRGTR